MTLEFVFYASLIFWLTGLVIQVAVNFLMEVL